MPEFDWSDLNGAAVDRLRAPKIVPVPDSIIKQAQRSVDGDPQALKKTLVLRQTFPAAKAEAFARFMKRAGGYTKPPTSMSVVLGKLEPGANGQMVLVKVPDGEKPEQLTVAWKAGKRRGKAVA